MWITRYVVIGLTVIGLVGVVWFLRKKYLKAKRDTRPLLLRFRELFSSDKTPRDHEMQERGDRSDSDENVDFLGVGTPDDMRTGPPRARAPVNAEGSGSQPVNLGEAARLARDQRARDDLQDELRAEARVRAEMHHQSSSSGATGATSRHSRH